MSDLNIDSVLELDALVRSHDEMIVMVSKLERSDFKTKVPVGFSLLILSYILAAEKFKEERTLATWLDEHFTGHPVDQCSFARGILCATMVKGNDDGPQHRTDFGKRTGTQGD